MNDAYNPWGAHPVETETTQPEVLVPDTIQTSIAEISVLPAVSETSAFQAVLSEIPEKVKQADELLSAYRNDPENFLEAVDEEDLDSALKEMATVSSFVRDIEKARKDIRSYMNGVRDNLIENLNKRLDDAQYGKLEKAQADIKQLKKDVDEDRRQRRWNELKSVFEANIMRYPFIAQFTPELADFSKFKLIYPKLVSGAKGKPVREADHVFIHETIYNWNTGIELMKENSWNLSPRDLNQLLTLFKQNPSVDMVQKEGRQLKINADAREKALKEAEEKRIREQKEAEEQAKKRAEEMKRIHDEAEKAKKLRDEEAMKIAEAKRRELEEKAKLAQEQERLRAAEFAKFGGQYQTIFKESFPKFVAYLFENKNYHDVHTSPSTKAAIIYDIMRQVERADSVVSLETHKDPQKVLDLVRYILDI